MEFDALDLFGAVKPGFFEKERIRSLPPEKVYEELILDLGEFPAEGVSVDCPRHIVFGLYTGDMEPLLEAVRSVNPGWVSAYESGADAYCAFDGNRIVSFCILEDFGVYRGMRIGGPGCVGTVREYRRQGIGLKMVSNATSILRERGYDIGYIHYTGVGRWYARLGYRTLVQWNCRGIIEQ